MEMSDYIVSKKNFLRNIFVIVGNFSKCAWCIQLKSIYGQTKTEELSKFITVSK